MADAKEKERKHKRTEKIVEISGTGGKCKHGLKASRRAANDSIAGAKGTGWRHVVIPVRP